MSWRNIFTGSITGKMAELETEFQSQLDSPIPIIAEVNSYLAKQGGKRIRPALLLLCAESVGYEGRGDIKLAATIEFIHTATLIHDDIIDNATLRRGQRAVNLVWGNNLTVLLGDYLYLKSMEMALTEKNIGLLDVLTEVTIAMIEGELIQVGTNGDLDLTREAYLDIIRRKTAALFSGCGRLAAELAAASDEERNALGLYCHNLGMAFQLVDDMLDFVADETVLGKPVVNDLKEGRVTLPIIELRELASADEFSLIKQIVESGQADDNEQEQLLALLKKHGTLESAASLAHEYAKEAKRQLAPIRKSRAKTILEKLPDYLLTRVS